jgi:hypothetical protein
MPYGTNDGPDVELGSGGGAGGNSLGCIDSGGRGGRGGGVVRLAAAELVTIEGYVIANGQQPMGDLNLCGYRPGGGGGSGGAILIAAPTIESFILGASLYAFGGFGGQALGADFLNDESGWGGGGGGGGRVKLFGTIDVGGMLFNVEGGEGGSAPNTNGSFPGNPGAEGTIFEGEEIPPEYTNLACD